MHIIVIEYIFGLCLDAFTELSDIPLVHSLLFYDTQRVKYRVTHRSLAVDIFIQI